MHLAPGIAARPTHNPTQAHMHLVLTTVAGDSSASKPQQGSLAAELQSAGSLAQGLVGVAGEVPAPANPPPQPRTSAPPAVRTDSPFLNCTCTCNSLSLCEHPDTYAGPISSPARLLVPPAAASRSPSASIQPQKLASSLPPAPAPCHPRPRSHPPAPFLTTTASLRCLTPAPRSSCRRPSSKLRCRAADPGSSSRVGARSDAPGPAQSPGPRYPIFLHWPSSKLQLQLRCKAADPGRSSLVGILIGGYVPTTQREEFRCKWPCGGGSLNPCGFIFLDCCGAFPLPAQYFFLFLQASVANTSCGTWFWRAANKLPTTPKQHCNFRLWSYSYTPTMLFTLGNGHRGLWKLLGESEQQV
eukprot:1162070-Pelagomonas_calceolata.AAC.9